jgi:poly(3-hydroxybutyrate) depolymerase
MHSAAVLMRKTAALALTLFALSAMPAASEPLPGLSADLSRTSVSGLSSGAYMAGQFEIAHSTLVIGAGIVAGGPYGCANSPGATYIPFWPLLLSLNLDRALHRCMEAGGWFGSVPEVRELATQAEALQARGRIDPLSDLKSDKIYIFSGASDKTIERPVVERAVELYEELGVPRASITFVKHEKAAHGFITDDAGLACGKEGEPFIEDCDYDQAKAILEAIYGQLKGVGSESSGRYLTFDQKPFISDGAGMAEEGVAYVPSACSEQSGCVVHVVFHGCKQERTRLGDTFIRESGYARWAANNRIIVLFPQIKATTANPNGCWDWWGYTGLRFLERDAPQMRAVTAMLNKLAEAR